MIQATIGSAGGPVRAGLAWARPEWGDVMILVTAATSGSGGRRRPPVREARRGRDQVVKLDRIPGRDPSRGAGETRKLEAVGCH